MTTDTALSDLILEELEQFLLANRIDCAKRITAQASRRQPHISHITLFGPMPHTVIGWIMLDHDILTVQLSTNLLKIPLADPNAFEQVLHAIKWQIRLQFTS